MLKYLYKFFISVLPLSFKKYIVLLYRKIIFKFNRLNKKNRFLRLLWIKVHQHVSNYMVLKNTKWNKKELSDFESTLYFHDTMIQITWIEDLPVTRSNKALVFVEANAAKLNYDDLVRLTLIEEYYLVFRSKYDYLEFYDYFVSLHGEMKFSSSRVSYISTIDPSIDESVYSTADELSDKFVDTLARSLSNSNEFNKFSNFLRPFQVGISDRFVGWVRNIKFALSFIEANDIEHFYIFGNNLVDNNLLAFYVSDSKNIPCGILKPWNVKALNLKTHASLPDVVSRYWVGEDRFSTTKYRMLEHCNEGDDIIVFFGNLKDPMYRETLQPVLDGFAQKTDKKILVLLPHADSSYDEGDADNSSYSYVLPSVLKDNMPCINEFNNYFDLAIDELLLSEYSFGSQRWLLALYVVLNARQSVHRVTRDCYGLMQEVDKVTSVSNIVALVSNPGRIWPSQFIVGYLNSTPSFDIQSGTFIRSARYKKPISKYILSVDDFSKSVYVDYLGVESSNVEVVGAPRIDARLSSIRKYSQQESRDIIAVCESKLNILCLATQPYDIDLMSSMVREACDFVESNDDWFLLISMHPNENNVFEGSYNEILRASSCSSRTMISGDNIYHNLNASDAVITYFSTAGLEAFCLKKPVLAYRPLSYPSVPFDLCALGVARSFVNAEDLQNLLNSRHHFGVQSEGLKRLRDARSVERICDFVMAKI